MTGIPGTPTAAIIVPFAAGFNSKLLLPEEMELQRSWFLWRVPQAGWRSRRETA